MTVVLLNALWLAVDTELNDASSLADSPVGFQAVEHTFCVIFVAEIMVRFAAFAKKKDCCRDKWFLFDLLLVTIMVVETWFIPIILSIVGDEASVEALRHFSAMRMLRLLRLTRIARLLRAVPEILTLIKGIGHAVRGVASTVFLLFVILFVFAIIFKDQARADEEIRAELFPTVWWSMWSLLMFATFLDGPAAVYTAIQTGLGRHMALLFLVVIFISAFTVLNMLIGILCEVVTEVSASEKEEAQIAYLKANILDILECYDIHEDGTIRRNEFRLLMENLEFREAIHKFGADAQDLQTLAEVHFVKNHTDTLSFQDLLGVVLRLKGGNSAQVMDVVDLREYVKQRSDNIEASIAKLGSRMGVADAESANTKVEDSTLDSRPLKVKVIGATNLRNADTLPGQGTSDAYCTCMIVGKPETTQQTKVIPNNLNPVWNETFYLPDFVPGNYIRFHLFDRDNQHLKKDDDLGSVTLTDNHFYPHGYRGELLLGHAGKNEAYLFVEIGADEVAVSLSASASPVNVGSPQKSGAEADLSKRGSLPVDTLQTMLARLDELCSGQRELRTEVTVLTQRMENLERSFTAQLPSVLQVTCEEA